MSTTPLLLMRRRPPPLLWRAVLQEAERHCGAAPPTPTVAERRRAFSTPPAVDDTKNTGPLAGVKVLDITQVVAGNVCSSILAHFGADVIKLEPPACPKTAATAQAAVGDPIRGLRDLDSKGTSYWWRSLGRNRRCVTADLRTEQGRQVARRLALEWPADVLVENFRPGVLESHGLGPQDLPASVVFARISGYGQTGPRSAEPGYASVCEAGAGLRHLNGVPGQVPVRLNASLGDTLAGLYASLGAVMALLSRQRPGPSHGKGQVVDASIHECVASVLDAAVTEAAAHAATAGKRGSVRGPSGSTISGVVPTGTFATKEGRFVIIGGNGESVYSRLMRAIGRPEMDGAVNPHYKGNANRIEREGEIMLAIDNWTQKHSLDEVVRVMKEARVPAGPLATPADLLSCPQYEARGFLQRAKAPPKEEEGGGRDGGAADEGEEEFVVHAWPPFLSGTPGGVRWAGAELGQHTDEVLRGILGMDDEEIRRLREVGAV
jgi:crotonobetainyl-CoA:carnitine CoA-transferase CaiB-like acyl-CoA transferase